MKQTSFYQSSSNNCKKQFQRFISTLLLFCMCMQSCNYGQEGSSQMRPTIEELVYTYAQQLPMQNQQNFKSNISPILKEKLKPLPEQESTAIFQKLTIVGTIYPNTLETNSPNQWVTKNIIANIFDKLQPIEEKHSSALQKINHHISLLETNNPIHTAEDVLYSLLQRQKTIPFNPFDIQLLLHYIEAVDPQISLNCLTSNAPNWIVCLKANWLLKTFTVEKYATYSAKECETLRDRLLRTPWMPEPLEILMTMVQLLEKFDDVDPILQFIETYNPSDVLTTEKINLLISNKILNHKNITDHLRTLVFIRQIQKYPIILQNPAILSALDIMLKNIKDYALMHDTFEVMSAKNSLHSVLNEFSSSLHYIQEYNPNTRACTESINVFKNEAPIYWQEKIHEIVVNNTFHTAHELEVEEIAKTVAQKSTNTPFVNNDYSLVNAYKSIETSYNGKCKEPSISTTEIKYWSKGLLAEWAKRVKAKEYYPSENEIVAAVMQAAKLHNGFLPRDTQILSLISLLNKPTNNGRLAQINTGEGKSLIVAMLAAIKALQGNTVDVITTSAELSRPEVVKQRPFFSMLNLTVDENTKGCAEIYGNDIVYGTAGNFQGDILRTEFSKLNTTNNRKSEIVIVDEVDSMLFDNRDQSIKLSSLTPAMNHLGALMGAIWYQVNTIVKHIYEKSGLYLYITEDFEINGTKITLFSGNDPKEATLQVNNLYSFIFDKTENHLKTLLRDLNSIERADYEQYRSWNEQLSTLNSEEEQFKITAKKIESAPWHRHYPIIQIPQHLYEFARMQIPIWIQSAISALFLYKKEVHYIIKDEEIKPVDYSNTGVVQMNMVWGNGLAQMLQLKEGVPLQPENLSTNSMSGPTFFKRYGSNIYGLTGTIGDETTKAFFGEVYNTDSVVIPPYKIRHIESNAHSPYVCKELPAIVLEAEDQWYNAIINTNIDKAKHNRAILIICRYIAQVKKIEELLKAKYDPKKVYPYTGQEEFHKEKIDFGEIIVATNIAGRGTDITTSEKVEENGGMHVCITFLPDNYRVELQNAGRTARQGKKGSAQLIIHQNPKYPIDALRADRKYRESTAIKTAILDVKQIVFRDRLFDKFCALSNEVIPNEDECTKIEFSEILADPWKLIEKNELDPNLVENIYNKKVKEEAKSVFLLQNEEALAKFTPEERIQNQPLIDSLILETEKNIKKNSPIEKFTQERRDSLLNALCKHQKAEVPSDVIEAIRKGGKYIPQYTALSQGKNWDKYERYAIEERWALWLMANAPDSGNLDEEELVGKFERFADTIRQDAKNDRLVKNPFYYVQKGNSRPTVALFSSGLTTSQCYQRAIDLDPQYSLNALYNYALYLLSFEENRDCQQQAKELLNRAKILIQSHYKPELLSLNVYAGNSNAKPELFKHLQHQTNVLCKQEEYIGNAIAVIDAAQNEDWDVELENVRLEEAFKDADEDHKMAIGEANANGLTNFFTLTLKEPTNYWGILGVAILGIMQVAAGAIIFINTGGSYGMSLISEGISDIITAAKSALTGGKFSWANYVVNKGISLAVSVISAGWDAIKKAGKALKEGIQNIGSTSAQVLKQATLDVGKALGKAAIKETIASTAEYAFEKTIGKEIENQIEEKVEAKIVAKLSSSAIVQRAIALDIKRSSNKWQRIIIQEGQQLLAENHSNWLKFFDAVGKVGKGVASNKIDGAARFFQAAGATKAVYDLLNYTDSFIDQLITKIETLHREQIEKDEKDDASKDTEPKVDYGKVIHKMNTGTYHRSNATNDRAVDQGGYYSKSDPAKVAKSFSNKISSKLSSGIQSAVINPILREATSMGVESVMGTANKDVDNAKKELRGEPKTYDLADYYPELQEKKSPSLLEDAMVNKDTLEEKVFKTPEESKEITNLKRDLQSRISLPSMDLQDLLNRHNASKPTNQPATTPSKQDPEVKTQKPDKGKQKGPMSRKDLAEKNEYLEKLNFNLKRVENSTGELEDKLKNLLGNESPIDQLLPLLQQQRNTFNEYTGIFHDRNEVLEEMGAEAIKDDSYAQKKFDEIVYYTKKLFKIIVDRAKEDGPAMAKEAIINTALLATTGPVGPAAYNLYRLGKLLIQLPEIYEQAKNVCENYEHLTSDEKLELYANVGYDALGLLLAKTGKKLNITSDSKRTLAMGLADGVEKRVGNMKEFFSKTEFGGRLQSISQRSNRLSGREKLFKVTAKNDLGLNKGDHYYLDKSHKDYFHIEVFDSEGDFKFVLNMNGIVDKSKTIAAKNRKLNLN